MLELGHFSVAHQTPLSMRFPRQEYWSGLPYPPPGDLLDAGIEPESPAFFSTGRQILFTATWEAFLAYISFLCFGVLWS